MSEIDDAARLILEGQLVAFPTETVYGLGANALDAAAVARIFEAKGRPRTSPMIVHVSSIEMARALSSEWSTAAAHLAARFWPGPLTIVVRKTAAIPDIVTAGLPTVGLRCPAHPIALDLVRTAGVPIAAPSANRFTELSPTTAAHVRKSLAAMVLDGGPSTVGIESTVVSVATTPPRLLRLGAISRAEIEAVIGPVDLASPTGPHESPGMHPRHYAPRTPLVLIDPGAPLPAGRIARIPFIGSPPEYSARLYATLHALDAESHDAIAVELPPDTPEWAAVLDRLRRAAT